MVGQFGCVIGIYKKKSICIWEHFLVLRVLIINVITIIQNMSTFCSPITRSIVPVQYLLTFFHPHVYTPLDHYRCFYYLRTHCCSGVYLSSMRKHFINWSLCHVNELEKLSFLIHIKFILKSCGVLKFGTFSHVVSQDCTQKLQIFINEGMSDEMLINWYSSWSKYSHDASIAQSENGKKKYSCKKSSLS